MSIGGKTLSLFALSPPYSALSRSLKHTQTHAHAPAHTSLTDGLVQVISSVDGG